MINNARHKEKVWGGLVEGEGSGDGGVVGVSEGIEEGDKIKSTSVSTRTRGSRRHGGYGGGLG